MKKYKSDIIAILFWICLVSAFFYPTFVRGLLPIPSDSLVGLYHPWRDLYAKTNPLGVPFKNFLTTDPVRQQIPWRKIAIDQWKEGKIPRWNPYAFSGVSLGANIQAGVFYPFNFLFFIFDFPAAWTILIVLEPLLSGIFMYFFLRAQKLGLPAAMLGALVWSFSGFNVAWFTWGTMVHVALWLPLLLLAAEKLLVKPRFPDKFIIWFVILVVGLIFQLLAGHIQISLYVVVLTNVYVIWRYYTEFRLKSYRQDFSRKIFWLITADLIFILATVFQWLPLVKFVLASNRLDEATSWLKSGWFLPWQHLIQFFAPDFFGNPTTLNYWGEWNYGEFVGYVGIVPLLFAVYVVLAGWGRKVKFWLIIGLIALILALPNPASTAIFRFRLPFISALQPTRLMVIVDYCLAVLSAIGLDIWLKKEKKSAWLSIMIIGLLFLTLWIAVIWLNALTTDASLRTNLLISQRNLILPTALFVAAGLVLGSVYFANKHRLAKTVAAVLLLLITIFDLFRFGWKFIPFSPQSYFFPTSSAIAFLQKQPKPFRIASLDKRIFPPNTPAYYGIESIEGYDPVYPLRYGEFIAALERGQPDIRSPLGFERIITIENVDSPLLSMLNVGYLLSLKEINRPFLRLAFQEGDTRIYEYILSLPRAYLVSNVIFAPSKQKAIELLFDSQKDWRQTAVMEESITILNTPLLLDENVNIITYKPSHLELKVRSASRRLLVIANSFDSGWQAKIDGQPSKIYRANFVFQGVIIPAGSHTVDLNYL